jgi:hypothetical protein
LRSRGCSADFLRFERFGRSRCGTVRCLPLRERRAGSERQLVTLQFPIRFSRLQLIDRISASRMSQSSICEANTCRVDLRAVNKWKRDFAVRIAFNEFDSP